MLAALSASIMLGSQAGAKSKIRLIFPSAEVGITDFVATDYSMYPADERGFMDLNGKSIHITFNLGGGTMPLVSDGKLSLSGGIGIACDNYVFSEKVTITKEGGMIRPVPIDGSYKKSKFNTVSLKLPLTLDLNLRPVTVSAGAYGSAVISQHTKYKKPKHKEKGLGYMNTFQAGLTARVWYDCVGVFANYGLTDFFRHDSGPELHPLTIGLCFGW